MNPRVVNNLTQFSDDILLLICSKLNHGDLLSLIGTCERMFEVGMDHSLWRRVDLHSCPLSAAQVSRQVLRCLHQNTRYLRFKGHKRTKLSKWKTGLITTAILKTLGAKCPALADVTFSEAVVNARQVKLADFKEVSSVSSLSFIDCEFINLPSPTIDGSYFKGMPTYLPNLKSLEISHSNWINDYDLMVLSKLDSLEKLVLKCSLRIGITTSYLAIGFRFGFKSLQELDMRGTSLTNMEIQSISQSGLLQCLKLGPIGKVKRLKNDINEGFGLVIPDPHKRDEPVQQVVVINMNSNGTEWRQADDDDLEKMGLNWIKKKFNKVDQSHEEDEHFFIGKEGKIVRIEADNEDTSSEEEEDEEFTPSGTKRKLLNEDTEGPPLKKRHLQRMKPVRDADVETARHRSDSHSIDETCIPDELLSDSMVVGFRYHGQNLCRLELVGCAITDNGVLELVKYLPKLVHLDVSQSYVTAEGAQRGRIISPGCTIICTPQTR